MYLKSQGCFSFEVSFTYTFLLTILYFSLINILVILKKAWEFQTGDEMTDLKF